MICCAFRTGAQVCGILLCCATLIIGVYAACGKAKGMRERKLLLGISCLFGLTSGGLTALSFAMPSRDDDSGIGASSDASWPLEVQTHPSLPQTRPFYSANKHVLSGVSALRWNCQYDLLHVGHL